MQSNTKPNRTWFRLLRLALVTAGTGYALIGAMLYLAQDSLIFAGSMYQGSPHAEFKDPFGGRRLGLTTRAGERLVAVYVPSAIPRSNKTPPWPTLIWFYGNGMMLADSLENLEQFSELGYNVVAADYPGYGLSAGKASEAGCYRTADALLEWVRKQPELANGPMVAGGWSMGGAVAIDLAAREKVDGVIALSTFTSMTEVASAQYPWLPVPLLLRHQFESERKLREVRCPILLGHGSEDSLARLWMFERNRIAAAGPVQAFVIDGAGHNDFFSRGSAEIDRNLAAFRATLQSN